MRVTCLALAFAGLVVLLGPLLPMWPTHGELVLRVVIAFLCFYVAIMIYERKKLRRDFKEIIGTFYAFNVANRPSNEDAKRKAVIYMIDALQSDNPRTVETALAQLRRLTGQELGDSPQAWRTWWETNAARFRFPDHSESPESGQKS